MKVIHGTKIKLVGGTIGGWVAAWVEPDGATVLVFLLPKFRQNRPENLKIGGWTGFA